MKPMTIIICSLLFLTACFPSASIEGFVKSLPAVQEFLDAHPDADIRILSWDAATVQANQERIAQACGQQLPAKSYYYVTVEEKGTTLQLWLDRETNEAVCIFRKGAESDDGREEGAKSTGIASASRSRAEEERQAESGEEASTETPSRAVFRIVPDDKDETEDEDDGSAEDDEEAEEADEEGSAEEAPATTPQQPSFAYTVKSKTSESAEITCTSCTEQQCREACDYEIGSCPFPKLSGFGYVAIGENVECECSCRSLE